MKPNTTLHHRVVSPADDTDLVFEFCSSQGHASEAVQAAEGSYLSWSSLSQEQRNVHLHKLASIYQKKEEEIAVCISRETGKPLWESRQEAHALASKITVTIDQSLPLVRDQVISSSGAKVIEEIRYKSRGVFVVIGPFNFPVHLPNGQIIAALVCGNTVVFKPSEKTPASAQKIAECFQLAGFPKGVFNLVQGGASIASTLIQDSKTAGILFTGSYEVGQQIKKQTWKDPQKILALEMGGKNSTVVWKSADIKHAVWETLNSVYLTAGQRCSSTSRLILHSHVYDEFLERFIKLSRQMTIGHWKENPFMGPLISSNAVEKYKSALLQAEEQSANILLKGAEITSLNGYFVSPSIVEPKAYDSFSPYQNEELFAPFLSVYVIDQEEKVWDMVNYSGYGLCLSVFCEEKTFVQKLFQRTTVGVFNWNLRSNGASARLPFGGLRKSGNDRPAGLFSIMSCSTPIACRRFEPDSSTQTPPSHFFHKEV